ncbi:MAG TPA: DNA polymerase III subunit alpha [Acidobacteriota bacterium]|nr:DNA polymerase III subunit alpha [Acidobacteriota bacterium]
MLVAHLHCHSCYSLLRGADRPEALAAAAARAGIGALALTETGGLYSAVAHQKACEAEGIAPVFGAELPSRSGGGCDAVLLARSRRGWAKLCRLVTAHATDKEYDLVEELAGCHDLFLLSRSRELLQRAREVVPAGLLFAELVVHGDPAPARRLARWADENGIPPVATNDVHFADPSGHETAAVLAAIRLLKTVGTLASGDAPAAEAWLATPAEMEKRFRWIPAALANAAAIAEQCRFRLPLGHHLLPRYDRLRECRASSSLAELRGRCLARMLRRFPDGPPPQAIDRLGAELGVVAHNGFADYFLIVDDIVREADSRGVRTLGRGSAAASIICYLLGITHVDPLRHNLAFERFMNDGRSDLPDIDLDFPWNRRDEMVEFVYERFGRERVAMISTHATFRARAGLREVAKAMGLPDEEIGRVTKRVPHYIPAAALDDAASDLPECRNLPLHSEPWKSIARLARRVDGFPRHLSVHPCGLVIAPQRIDEIVPLETAAKGLLVTQMDMYPVEDLGLVKIDLLGQRALAVISDTIGAVNSRNGRPPLGYDDLALDASTARLLRTGETMGCFYIESPGMRSLMAKLQVADFELLTAASSVIRPGPSDSGMMRSFVERHRGREPVRHLHPKMESLLGETHGVMIYQEDVIRVAHAVAGMSMADADRMRRSMTKKRHSEPIARLRERFLEGAAREGVEKKAAEEIWRQIASFAGYAFCKSHSASFAQVSIQAAHLRAHYPAEFMAAVLSNGGGFYHAAAYIEEARRMGLRILPPYVDKARVHYRGRNGALMVGLMAVKNLSEETARRIVELQPYSDLGDFLARVRPARDEGESLVSCGALDRFGYNRPQLMWLIQQKQRETGEGLLEGIDPLRLEAPDVPDYSLSERLRREMEALDFTVTAHPLALYCDLIKKEGVVAARNLARHAGRFVTTIAWLVHAKRTRTCRGEYMKFLSVEDLTSAYEAVLFPQAYDRFGGLLRGRGPYLLRGRVARDAGAVSLSVEELENVG